MDVREFLGPQYLKHQSLPADLQLWEIAKWDVREYGHEKQRKLTLYFKEFPKFLGCNKTIIQHLESHWGYESDAWVGKKVWVFREWTDYAGSRVMCVRLLVEEAGPPKELLNISGQAYTTEEKQPVLSVNGKPPTPDQFDEALIDSENMDDLKCIFDVITKARDGGGIDEAQFTEWKERLTAKREEIEAARGF